MVSKTYSESRTVPGMTTAPIPATVTVTEVFRIEGGVDCSDGDDEPEPIDRGQEPAAAPRCCDRHTRLDVNQKGICGGVGFARA